VNWESALLVAAEHPEVLLTIDEALVRLSEEAPEHAKVVELIFFAGLTGDETAEALDVSPSTIDRRWRFARAWLHRELMSE
jgi:DNA-directed RNA polymerase specialized sigma24 family protein